MLFFRDIHVLQSLPLEILLHEAPIFFTHEKKVSEKVIIQIENWNVFTKEELFGIFG